MASKKNWRIRWRDLSPIQKQIREKALEAIASMKREDLSLTQASKKVGLKPKEVINSTNAVRKDRRRWKPKLFDRISAWMIIYEEGQVKNVETRDSRNRSLIGKYHNIVKQYVNTGRKELLNQLNRIKFKDAQGKTHTLETDPQKLYEIKTREAEPEFYEIYTDQGG